MTMARVRFDTTMASPEGRSTQEPEIVPTSTTASVEPARREHRSVLVHRTLRPDLSLLFEVREEVASVLAGAGVDNRAVGDLLLVQGELLVNAIEARPPGRVELTVTCVDGEVIEISVRNRTTGLLPPPADWAMPPASAPRGRGLRIVSSLSDGTEVHQDGDHTEVTAWRRFR